MSESDIAQTGIILLTAFKVYNHRLHIHISNDIPHDTTLTLLYISLILLH